MILALVLGIGAGLGLAGIVFGLAPRPGNLEAALVELHRPRPRHLPSSDGIAPALTGLARALGLPRLISQRVREDLAITGHGEDWYLSWSLLLGLLGLATGPIVSLLALLLDVHLAVAIAIALSVIGGPGAVATQVASVHTEAERRRKDFSFALSAYLDLVVVSMASGRGVEGALANAAEHGQGFAFSAIRAALTSASLRGIAPWDAIEELGVEYGVAELEGLAASIRLAGASGAKVRSSIATRARSLRTRTLAAARAEAESATERMSMPVVLLVLGFLVLISYPAIVQISTQL